VEAALASGVGVSGEVVGLDALLAVLVEEDVGGGDLVVVDVPVEVGLASVVILSVVDTPLITSSGPFEDAVNGPSATAASDFAASGPPTPLISLAVLLVTPGEDGVAADCDDGSGDADDVAAGGREDEDGDAADGAAADVGEVGDPEDGTRTVDSEAVFLLSIVMFVVPGGATDVAIGTRGRPPARRC
jgi:hypothetical protein